MPPIRVNLNVPGEAHPQYQFVDGGVREYAGVQIAIDNGATEIFTILLSSGQPDPDDSTRTNLFSILEKTVDIFIDDVGINDLLIPFQYIQALKYIDLVKNNMKRSGMSEAVVNDFFRTPAFENPFQDKAPIKIYTIRPGGPLGGGAGGLAFEPATQKTMVTKGETAADGFIASLSPGEITWA